MIQAYISIGLKSGMKVQYVRDITNDSLGKGKTYYGYRGAAYQDLGMKDRKVVSLLNLESGVKYYFKVNIDGKGSKEYYIEPIRNKSTLYQAPHAQSFANEESKGFDKIDIVKLLNAKTIKDEAKWLLTPYGDIRCQSISKSQGTSIILEPGTTGRDLFASINADLQTAIPGDQLLDQTGIGKVYGDFLFLSRGVGQLVKESVSYVIGTPKDIYAGDLKTLPTSFNTYDLKVFVNGMLQKPSEPIFEEIESAGGTVSTVQTTNETYSTSYDSNFIVFTTGNNTGEVRQIVNGSGNVFNLDADLPYNIEIGDKFNILTSYDYLVLESGVKFAYDLTAGDYVFIQQNDTQDGSLVFPESTDNTNMLIRKNNNESLSGAGDIITQIPISAITEIAIVEKTITL